MPDDGVGPGRIHDVQFFEQRQGIGVNGKALIHDLLGGPLAPLDQGYPRSSGCGAFFQDLLPQQGVDQRALARVELPDDHQQKQLVKLQDRLLKRVKGLARYFQAGQCQPDLRQGFLFLAQESGLFFGEHRFAHQDSSCLRVPQVRHSDG